MAALIGTFVYLLICFGLPLLLAVRLIRRARRRKALEKAGVIVNPEYHAYRNLYGSARESPVTMSIIAILFLVYIGEIIFAYGPLEGLSPSVLSLIAQGGVNHNLVVEDGQWYRLLTAAFLHGSPEHLFFNCMALYYAGLLLEKILGHAWLLAIYFICAVTGAVFSIMINPPDMVSVGASGAIMGLFGVMLVTSYRLRPEEGRAGVLSLSLRVLIPSLLPLATSAHIDIGAHAGGAVAGAACGCLLLVIWPGFGTLPALRGLATVIAAIGILLSAIAFEAVGAHYSSYEDFSQIAGQMIPNDQMPRTPQEKKEKAAALVAKYPEDPRGHMDYAIVLSQSGYLPGAEEEMRVALAKTDKFRLAFKKFTEFRNTEYAMLALIMLEEGKSNEARTIANSLCTATGDDALPPDTLKTLYSLHLCADGMQP